MSSNPKKKKNLVKRLMSHAKSMIKLAVSDILQEAKDNAESLHGVKLDLSVKNKLNGIASDLSKELLKRPGSNIDGAELLKLFDSAKEQIIKTYDPEKVDKTLQQVLKKVDEYEFDEDDLDSLAMESLDEIAVKVAPGMDLTGNSVLGKDRMIASLIIFIHGYIKDENFLRFMTDKSDSIKDLLSGYGVDIEAPEEMVAVVTNSNPEIIKDAINEVEEKIDEEEEKSSTITDPVRGEVTISHEDISVSVIQPVSEYDSDKNNVIISVGENIKNKLLEMDKVFAENADNESTYSSFMYYFSKLLDLYNIEYKKEDSVDFIMLSCPIVKMLIESGIAQPVAIHLTVCFYLELPNDEDYSVLDNFITIYREARYGNINE